MKNLENYGVQELDTKEIRETEGGVWPIVRIITAIISIGSAIDYAAEEFAKGWNNPK